VGALWEIMAFLLVITPLVFVHELGHFIFAKLFNVKVKTFSIFMGKKLFTKKIGETEYSISAIPVGGYVSLIGEDPSKKLPPEEEKRALYSQPLFQRFLIIVAGPVFNIFLTVAIYILIISIGNPVKSNVIQRIVPYSVAYHAGLRAGDRITGINDRVIKNYREYLSAIAPLTDSSIRLEYTRDGKKKDANLKTSSMEGSDKFGKPVTAGYIQGIEALPLNTVIGISNPSSPAGKIGLKTGDTIISINRKKVNLWDDLEKEFSLSRKKRRSSIDFMVKRKDATIPFQLRLKRNSPATLREAGIESAELYIHDLLQDYPAQKYGLLKNDRLLSINEQVIYCFKDFYNQVQKKSESKKPLSVAVIRKGNKKTFNLIPRETEDTNSMGEKVTHYYIGVRPYQNVYGPDHVEPEQISGPVNIINKAISRTAELTEIMVVGFWKLLTGALSPGQLSGPLMISKLAGDILSTGALFFLRLMAIISLDLAIINLIPFPALDGGHLLIIAIETLSRRKLPPRAIAFVSYIGFFLLMSLMLAITVNDIFRRFF